MQKKQKEIIDQFQKKELKRKVPQHILAAFCHITKTEYKGETTYEKISYDSEMKEAIRQQQEIEIHLMLRGFLAKGWMQQKSGSLTPRATDEYFTVHDMGYNSGPTMAGA